MIQVYWKLFGALIAVLVSFDLMALDDERNFKKGETLFVHSFKGLNLRSRPLITAKVLVRMPYGGKVVVTQLLPRDRLLTVDNITGYWIGVRFGKHTGYTFSGFVSRLPVPGKEWKVGLNEFRSKLSAARIPYSIEQDKKTGKNRKTAIVLSNTSVLDGMLVLRKLASIPNHLKLPRISSKERMETSDRKSLDEFFGRTLSVIRKDGKVCRLSYQYIYQGGTQRASIQPVGKNSVRLYIENNIDD